MQIVIDIDEKVKKYLDQTTTSDMEDHYVKHFSLWIAKAIKEGTVLPKGHGDLVDRDALSVDFYTDEKGHKECVVTYDVLEDAPIVIPADKGEE